MEREIQTPFIEMTSRLYGKDCFLLLFGANYGMLGVE